MEASLIHLMLSEYCCSISLGTPALTIPSRTSLASLSVVSRSEGRPEVQTHLITNCLSVGYSKL